MLWVTFGATLATSFTVSSWRLSASEGIRIVYRHRCCGSDVRNAALLRWTASVLASKLALHEVRDAEALCGRVIARSRLELDYHEHERTTRLPRRRGVGSRPPLRTRQKIDNCL